MPPPQGTEILRPPPPTRQAKASALTASKHLSREHCEHPAGKMADGRIVKLVFLMVESADGRAPPRKAVVPLVEGCDFENFLHRLRRRLGVADTVTPTISDTATGAVDSIDRLLEVDEGTTLHVQVPFVPQEYALSSPSPTVGASGTSSAVTPSPASQVRGATHRASVVSPPGSACSNGADASGGAHGSTYRQLRLAATSRTTTSTSGGEAR